MVWFGPARKKIHCNHISAHSHSITLLIERYQITDDSAIPHRDISCRRRPQSLALAPPPLLHAFHLRRFSARDALKISRWLQRRRVKEKDMQELKRKIYSGRGSLGEEEERSKTSTRLQVQGDLKGVAKNVGKMAEVMEREAAIQEKVMNNDPQQMLREKAVAELWKLGFTGTEQIKVATVF
ncbi:hypothetical protein HU200_059781 [Digitaria exilis]|uniref:MLLE-like domain-containing protein n=1 Tax=Digitaria exilis TaxID=1010633 RepID=A0A835A7D1_9POAL|nr:hypothetical protein HU200_059781 [Digitaria exilis]